MIIRILRLATHLGSQRLNLFLKPLILRNLPLQKLCRQLGFLCHPGRRKQIGVAQLVSALAEILHLDPTFLHQGLEAEIDSTKANAQISGKRTLTDPGRSLQTAQDFELNFLLETSQFLKGRYEAHDDLVMRRFTISKHGLRGGQQGS